MALEDRLNLEWTNLKVLSVNEYELLKGKLTHMRNGDEAFSE